MAATAVVASVLGGLLGAGGQVGGGLIGAESTPDQRAPGSLPLFNPGADPVVGGLSLQNLALLGIADPSLIQNAGPLAQAKNLLSAQGFPGGTGDLTGQEKLQRRLNAPDQINALVARARSEGFSTRTQGPQEGGGRVTEITPEQAQQMSALEILEAMGTREANLLIKSMRDLVAVSPFGSIEELLAAEEEFQASLAPILEANQAQSQIAREATLLSQAQQLGLLQDLPTVSQEGILGLRDDFLAREAEILDEFDRSLLRQANVGGFNPAGGLRESARLRETADAQALTNAISLILGQQQGVGANIANLQALDPSRFALPLAQGTGQIRNPFQTGPGVPATAGGVNPAGAGVAAAGAGLQNTANTLALLSLLNQGGQAPATANGATLAPAASAITTLNQF